MALTTQGSTFTFTLPYRCAVKKLTHSAKPEIKSCLEIDGAKRRILKGDSTGGSTGPGAKSDIYDGLMQLGATSGYDWGWVPYRQQMSGGGANFLHSPRTSLPSKKQL